MASTINATTSGVVTTGDSVATLSLQTGGTTAVAIDTAQIVTLSKSLALLGSTSGSVTLSAPAVAGSTTLTLPATSGTLLQSGTAVTVAQGGTGLTAGTSGGVPYYSSNSAITSSAALTQYGIVYGGGAGNAPVATAAGTTGQFLGANTSGAPTWQTPTAGAGGSNTQIQYNATNALAGSANFIWDNANTRLGVANASPSYTVDVTGGSSSGFTPGIRTQFSNSANAGCIQIGNDPTGGGVVCGLRIYGDTGGGTIFNTYRNAGGAPFHQFQVNATIVATMGSDGSLTLPSVYAKTVTTPRNVFIDSSGSLGGISSVRESKTNINALSSAAWIQQLNPVKFNYRKKDEDGAFTEEFESENQFGLIAEEVEAIQPDLCIYVDGKLQGIHYDRMVAPLIKAIQELTARIAALEAK